MGDARGRWIPVQVERQLIDLDLAKVAAVEAVGGDRDLAGGLTHRDPCDSGPVGRPRRLGVYRAGIGEFGGFAPVGQHREELEVRVLNDEAAVILVLLRRRFLFVGAEVGLTLGGREHRALRTAVGCFVAGHVVGAVRTGRRDESDQDQDRNYSPKHGENLPAWLSVVTSLGASGQRVFDGGSRL